MKSSTPYWRYNREREAPWPVWLFVIGYSAGVILLLYSILWVKP